MNSHFAAMACSSSTSQSLSSTVSVSLRLSPPGSSPARQFRFAVTMRDRSNNPRPLQKGRNLSIEAIQTVQTLKRANRNVLGSELESAFERKFRRLLKRDMIAVLRELLRQKESLLALKVFEDIRKECWYKPQVSLYADVIGVLGSNGLTEQVEPVYSYLKSETDLKPDIDGFNTLLGTLINIKFSELAMDCYYLMKQVDCDPDRSSFRILIKGLESMGETGSSGVLRLHAQEYYGESLDFLEENEDLALSL